MYVIITCKYEKDQIKNSREKVETSFSHYKPMGIFSDIQGQLTQQSVVQSGRNSNLSELSCMSSLHASMKRVRRKQSRKSGPTPFFFFSIITLSVTMETRGWIWPNFKLIQTLMYVIITYKYEKDPIKNSREKWRHHFSYYDDPLGRGQFRPQGHNWQDLCRVPLNIATH